jgi:predicted nuclease of predicted toxin-antitoxin system
LFSAAGHDVQTVFQESLQGASDQQLYEACCAEQRCLVTLDLDFADVLRFPPTHSGGIAVLRLPRNPTLSLLEALIRQLLHTARTVPLEGRLWIVEVGRIRIHQSDEDTAP